MKKVLRLTELDCAHCAQKMEDGIRALPGVQSATVNFFSQRLTLEADDEAFDQVLRQAATAIRRIEPGCRVEG